MQGVFAGVPTETLQGWLSQAQAAYVALKSGAKFRSVTYGMGEGQVTTTFQSGNIGACVALIGELQQALGMGRARAPLDIDFGPGAAEHSRGRWVRS